MHDHTKCGHKLGKIVVFKVEGRWQMIIWGGDGSHPLDGAEFDTFEGALYVMRNVVVALKTRNKPHLAWAMRQAARWCNRHQMWRPCPGCWVCGDQIPETRGLCLAPDQQERR